MQVGGSGGLLCPKFFLHYLLLMQTVDSGEALQAAIVEGEGNRVGGGPLGLEVIAQLLGCLESRGDHGGRYMHMIMMMMMMYM